MAGAKYGVPSTVPFKIDDFHVLPIALPILPSYPKPAIHYLYLKPDTPPEPTAASQRSLFLVNTPLDSTEEHFKHLFSAQLRLPPGRIQRVAFAPTLRDAPLPPQPDDPEPTTAAPLARTPSGRSKKRKHAAEPRDPAGPAPELAAAEFPGARLDRELHGRGGTATVEFVDRPSRDVALAAAKRACRARPPAMTWGEGMTAELPPLGSQRYINNYERMFPPRAELLESIDTFMTAYNERQDAIQRDKASKRHEPDADGFVTVTRGKAGAATQQEEVGKQLERQKEKQKGLGDFYRFQGREKRKEREMEIRRQFKEDQERLQKMRQIKGRYEPE